MESLKSSNIFENKQKNILIFIVIIFFMVLGKRLLRLNNSIIFIILLVGIGLLYKQGINKYETIFIVLLVLFYLKKISTEKFEVCLYNNELIKLINNIDVNNLYYNYDYDYDQVYINEISWDIFLLANKFDNLKDAINNKMIEIFRVIKINKDLRNYLIFNNLINNEGYPIFIDHSKEGYGNMLLLNEIKILLITSKLFKK